MNDKAFDLMRARLKEMHPKPKVDDHKLNQKLYSRALDLSWEVPFVMQSRYHAMRDACEKIASGLNQAEAKSFMDYAYERYKNFSNYAGD